MVETMEEMVQVVLMLLVGVHLLDGMDLTTASCTRQRGGTWN